LITLSGEIGERDDGGATLPYAVRLSPLRDGSCARFALVLHQRAEYLDAEPVTDVPVADIPLIEEACELGHLGVTVQRACGQQDLLQEEDAGEFVLSVALFEQHYGQILLLPDGELLPQPLFLKPGIHSCADIPQLDAAEGSGASEVLGPPLARGGICACVQPQLQPADETVERRCGRIRKIHRSFSLQQVGVAFANGFGQFTVPDNLVYSGTPWLR
jgi:hypothetical protein